MARIVEVFRDEIGGDLVEQRVLSCEQAVDGHHTIRTSLTLHAARYQNRNVDGLCGQRFDGDKY